MDHKKPDRPERVIQFGEGGFLRGFADWLLQIVNENTDFDGGVVVVQPIREGLCGLLEQQDCVYTLIMRGMENGQPRIEKKVIDVISRCVKPYDDYKAYLDLAKDPGLRFIISNTTDVGISYREGDRPDDAPPASFPAKLCALLYERFKAGLGGFIILPCELIEKNGETLKKIVLRYAGEWGLGEAFRTWVTEENTFYNTLVDRIVSGFPKGEDIDLGYEDNMLNTCELFHLWVIEGPRNILKELPFDKTGLNVIVTEDLSMYQTRKVRVLNGAHTAMIPYAMLSGIETVKGCMEDEKMLAFLKACVFDEILPTLDMPKAEIEGYANDVLERFNNPYIKHYCSSIAVNSISKFRIRVLPSLLEYIRRFGKTPRHLVFSLYSLIRFYKTLSPVDDPAFIAFMRDNDIKAILSNKALWGQDLGFLYNEVKTYEDPSRG